MVFPGNPINREPPRIGTGGKTPHGHGCRSGKVHLVPTAYPVRLLGLLGLLLAVSSGTAAEPAPSSPPGQTVSLGALHLDDCLALADQRQPALLAYRASLTAAQIGQQAVNTLRFPADLLGEIPFRQQQAALGITAASAGLDEAERQTIYAVTRTYFTVLYARQQERVAQSVVDRLKVTRDLAARMLKDGARDVSESDVDKSTVYLELAQTRQIEASKGVERAMAALREAIGLCPDAEFSVANDPLPRPTVQPNRQEIVAAALAHRGNLVEANAMVEMACLEVSAQRSSVRQRMETFAAMGDIHSQPVPQGVQNTEYSPGAVPPEMPTILAGRQLERAAMAGTLKDRAAAVAVKARNLIALEAEDAFLRWEQASQQTERAQQAAATGEKLAGNTGKDFAAGLKVKVEDVVNAHVLASQAKSQYNQFLYQSILALADLERITAGAFSAGLAKPPTSPVRIAKPE